jgi:hypothetical protein
MPQVAGLLSDVAIVVIAKRSSRSLQDTEKVEGENAKPPPPLPESEEAENFSARRDGVERSSSIIVNDLWFAFNVLLFLL